MPGTEQRYLLLVHEGDAWYLPYALKQAELALPGVIICLIGGSTAHRAVRLYPELWHRVWFVPAESLASDQEREFIGSYRHLSTSGQGFELFCWRRWFLMRQWMEANRVTSAAYVDSDVLVFPGAAPRLFPAEAVAADCGFLIRAQEHESYMWAASAHTSRWSADALGDFCDFALASFTDAERLAVYLEKDAWHRRTRAPGGICDMTGLYLYHRENGHRVENFAMRWCGSMFDLSINTGDNYLPSEYQLENGLKKFTWTDTGPVTLTNDSMQQPVRMLSAHFQGGSKTLMPQYCASSLPRRSLPQLMMSEARRTLGPLKRRLIGRQAT